LEYNLYRAGKLIRKIKQIAMSVIEEIKQKNDVVEVVGQYVQLKKAGRNFTGLCPFHSETRPSFFVFPERQSWHCFGACNTGGDVLSFVMKKEGIDFGEAMRLLADRVGVTIPSKLEPARQKKEKEKLDKIFRINQETTQYYYNLLINSPSAEKARKYINERGLSDNAISDFQLGFSPDNWEALKQYLLGKNYKEADLLEAGLLIQEDGGGTHDRFRNRLMFPISDIKGNIAGFGARALDNSMPKYLNSPQTPVFDKSGTLYGMNLAKAAIRQKDEAIIVEGYMDAITAYQYGFGNIIASMGTSITDKQLQELKKLTRNITLALDADSAGEEAMLRCVGYENSLDAEVKVITLPEGKDPDDVIKQDIETWQKLLSEAIPVIDYTINMMTAKLDLSTARDKSVAVDKLSPIIAEIRNEARLEHYIKKLSNLTDTKVTSIEVEIGKHRKARTGAKSIKIENRPKSRRPTLTNPREEYCLALLLQHPELTDDYKGLVPEYFENSENREIFTLLQNNKDNSELRESLDPALWEHLDQLLNKELSAIQVERKYEDCVRNLREGNLRNQLKIISEKLASEAESGSTTDESIRLQEQAIEISSQLNEVLVEERQGTFAKEVKHAKR